jgi:hypothetical protein
MTYEYHFAVSVFCAAWYIAGLDKHGVDKFILLVWSVVIHSFLYRVIHEQPVALHVVTASHQGYAR